MKKDIVGIQADKRKEEEEEGPSSPFLNKHLVKTNFWHHIPHLFFFTFEGKFGSNLKRPIIAILLLWQTNSPIIPTPFFWVPYPTSTQLPLLLLLSHT
jgi:hypothetical protein